MHERRGTVTDPTLDDSPDAVRPEFETENDVREDDPFHRPGPTEVVSEDPDTELADDQEADPDEEAEGSDDVDGEGVGADDDAEGGAE